MQRVHGRSRRRDGARSRRSTEPERHLKGNFRLSCQTFVTGCRAATSAATPCAADTCASSATRSDCRSAISAFELDPAVTRDGDRILIDGVEVERSTGPIHGIAMDLGTTTVVLRLIDLESGELIADTSFENPQRFGGSEVMSRIAYDTEHPGRLLMRTLAGYLSHAIEKFPVDPKTIYEMVVVGNSTMRDLFFRQSVYSIGQNPYRSITEIEMAEGKRTTTSLDADRAAQPVADSSQGARVWRSHHQRPRGRGRCRLHAGGGSGARRAPDRGHGHRHEHRVDRRQQASHSGGILSGRPGLRRRSDRLRHAGAGWRDRRSGDR